MRTRSSYKKYPKKASDKMTGVSKHLLLKTVKGNQKTVNWKLIVKGIPCIIESGGLIHSCMVLFSRE